MGQNITYEWLIPVMMGFIALLIAIIGYMINGWLSTMSANMDKMCINIESTNVEMRKYFSDNEKRHHGNELEIVRLKEHLNANG